MTTSDVLLAIAVLSALWGGISAAMIADALRKRGVKVNWLFLKVLITKYVGQYREVTLSETGRVGFWYYSFVGAMNLALVTAIIGLVLRAS